MATKQVHTKSVKDSWDDSSDEEMEDVSVVNMQTVNMQTVNMQTVNMQTVNMQDNCKNCYVCNHDIENDTSYYPQCENKALLDRMKEMDECSSDEEADEAEVICRENYIPEEYDSEDEGDYPSYDDECELMDKKMGMHIRF